jgi:hypothetical protein
MLAACCQSRRRRQHVIPDPHPNCCGSICQGIPLRRTKTRARFRLRRSERRASLCRASSSRITASVLSSRAGRTSSGFSPRREEPGGRPEIDDFMTVPRSRPGCREARPTARTARAFHPPSLRWHRRELPSRDRVRARPASVLPPFSSKVTVVTAASSLSSLVQTRRECGVTSMYLPKNAIGCVAASWPNSRRYLPPTRTSISQESRDAPLDFGAHHRLNSSG